MKRICGWCGLDMGEVEDKGVHAENQVTTGICDSCADFFTKNQANRPLSDFLNCLSYPVVVVNREGRIDFANDKACQMLGKSLDEFKGWLGGDAFQCAYARLPGGCGKTEHCKACTIRLNITKTYETGEAQNNVASCLLTKISGSEKEKHYIISTRKKEDMVFLKIEEAKEAKAGKE